MDDKDEFEAQESLEAEGNPDFEAPAADEPRAVEDFGVTADEQRTGTPLEQRLEAEAPESEPGSAQSVGASQDVGRLVGPDAEDGPDRVAEEVATDVGYDSGDFSAEESAVHIVE